MSNSNQTSRLDKTNARPPMRTPETQRSNSRLHGTVVHATCLASFSDKFRNRFGKFRAGTVPCTLGLLLLVAAAHGYAAGMIVNELSNGTSGSREFFELIVVGDAAEPLSAIDIHDWIIDDQNGDWSGAGTAPGFMRFNTTAPGCTALQSVVPGTLILVYNNDSGAIPSTTKNEAISAPDDLDDTNPTDGIFILPNTSDCLEGYNAPPYTGAMGATSWSRIALRNGGDAGQVRDAATNLFHGLSFGDVGDTTVPANGIDIADGGSSGSGRNYFLSCGDWFDAANYSDGDAATQDTPGVANNPENALLIERLSLGLVDYANLANAMNCAAIPPPMPPPTPPSPPEQEARPVPVMDKGALLALSLLILLLGNSRISKHTRSH